MMVSGTAAGIGLLKASSVSALGAAGSHVATHALLPDLDLDGTQIPGGNYEKYVEWVADSYKDFVTDLPELTHTATAAAPTAPTPANHEIMGLLASFLSVFGLATAGYCAAQPDGHMRRSCSRCCGSLPERQPVQQAAQSPCPEKMIRVTVQSTAGHILELDVGAECRICHIKEIVSTEWGLPSSCYALICGVTLVRDAKRIATLCERGSDVVSLTCVTCTSFTCVCPTSCFSATKASVLAPCARDVCVRRDTDTADDFSVKVFDVGYLDARERAAALLELRILQAIPSHPNLVTYHESFLDKEGAPAIFVATSLMYGDLRRVVLEAEASARCIPEPAVLTWVRQALMGLQHLHAHGVTHKDLRTDNVFLCECRRRVCIGDIAISSIKEGEAFHKRMSELDSPLYMSPELMRNEPYDFHVDMWAMGCIAFELCTLRPPFQASSLLDLVFQVVQCEPAWVLWSDHSGEIRDVVQRLLCKVIARRPTAADVLAEELFAEGRPMHLHTEDAWVFKGAMCVETEAMHSTCDQMIVEHPMVCNATSNQRWASDRALPIRCSGDDLLQEAVTGMSGSTIESSQPLLMTTEPSPILDPVMFQQTFADMLSKYDVSKEFQFGDRPGSARIAKPGPQDVQESVV
jgi:NIMA (never in mitosis gene a)-related kinase